MTLKSDLFNVGQKVEYLGGSARAKGIRKGARGEVLSATVSPKRGNAGYRIKWDNGKTTSLSSAMVKAVGGAPRTNSTPKPEKGKQPEKAQRVFTVPEGPVTEDPIKIAKEIVAAATVNMPVTQTLETKLADSPPAILSMFNALLELPASAEALGNEARRKAWHKMVQSQIMHGQYARQLR